MKYKSNDIIANWMYIRFVRFLRSNIKIDHHVIIELLLKTVLRYSDKPNYQHAG